MQTTAIKKIYGAIFILSATLMLSCSKVANDLAIQKDPSSNARSVFVKQFAVLCSPIPQDLAVPKGNKLVMQTYATGVQIYEVRRHPNDPKLFEWVNIAPLAIVYAKPDFRNELALHYKGPSWQFTKGRYKGEKVVATKLKGVVVDPSAVAWLLLKAVDSLSSTGNKITYIQRVCTTGGLAPLKAATESRLGELDSIPYTASYLFYTKD